MTEKPDGQVSLFDQDTWSGRTLLAHSAPTKDATSRQSSKKRFASQSRKPPILKCLKTDGQLGGGYRDVDGRWGVAWRVLDAQWWGVPQRRRRIALVADFGGTTAHEILFNPKGVYGHPETSGETWEGPSERTERGARESGAGIGQKSVFCLQGNGIDRADTAGCNGKGWREDVSYTLNTIDRPAVCAAFKLGNGERARSIGYAEEQAPTLNAECGGNKPAILDMTHTDAAPLTYRQNGFGDYKESDTASSCKQRDFKDATDLCTQYGIIRRLTPLECERLQGFPDGWTDIGAWTDENGKLHQESSDSARYKALGNSIALPPWKWVLKRICAQYERDATLGSLFDGIGGFPLLWTQLNGWNSVKWASEIEPFCIAVTKRHFGEEAITMIERLTAENAKAEAERDALLEIAKNGKDCDTCKNCAVCVKPGTDVAHWCDRCEEKCRCYGCGGDHWEWRGLPEAPEEGEKA